MNEFTYDFCFLYSNQPFDLMGLQIDDTLILTSDEFAIREDKAIQHAKIMTKSRKQLTTANSVRFNDIKIKLLKDENITLNQESHAGGIQIIKNQNSSSISSRGLMREKLTLKNQYLAQRARGAYVASICQSEASFDLAHAAQSTDFSSDDITSLNKRLQ